MDVISYGLVGLSEAARIGKPPPYDELLETAAELFDRMLTPEDGGSLEAGKEILRRVAAGSREHFGQVKGQAQG